jgi:hypothetical protein
MKRVGRGDDTGVRRGSLAEAVRFELTEGSLLRRFSRPVHSTALPRLQQGAYCSATSGGVERLSRPACE